MSASTDVPVTITPEAATRVAELGMQKELDQMIAHVREVVPDLVLIEVAREPPYEVDWEPVTITAYSDRPYVPGDNSNWELIRWSAETFPPQVLENMLILLVDGRPHAG
jgi:hypothetical protein